MQFIMSDIHGDYYRFFRMLKKIKFGTEDVLYIIGDIPNRGKQTFELLDYVMKTDNIIHIKGNHELFLQQYLEGNPEIIFKYAGFGGKEVINELNAMDNERKEQYHSYLSKLPIYKVVDVNGVSYVLTHSGFMADKPAIYMQDGNIDIVSSIEKWCITSEYQYLISRDIHYIPWKIRFPKLIVGHHPTAFLECDGIFFSEKYIDIDNGLNVVRGRKLACLRLEDMQEYYV
jgi:serine/threonine protein phosphatase 1